MYPLLFLFLYASFLVFLILTYMFTYFYRKLVFILLYVFWLSRMWWHCWKSLDWDWWGLRRKGSSCWLLLLSHIILVLRSLKNQSLLSSSQIQGSMKIRLVQNNLSKILSLSLANYVFYRYVSLCTMQYASWLVNPRITKITCQKSRIVNSELDNCNTCWVTHTRTPQGEVISLIYSGLRVHPLELYSNCDMLMIPCSSGYVCLRQPTPKNY